MHDCNHRGSGSNPDPVPKEIFPLPEGSAQVRDLPTWQKAMGILEAIRLIELGARAGMVCHLTGMDKASANRLYRQIHHRPSPSGQQPFTDSWYRRNELRMLHTALVWRLYRKFSGRKVPPARTLIEVYESYRYLVQEPLLDITQVSFVPKLVAMHLWAERACKRCRAPYIAPVDSISVLCPGCRLYQQFRCPDCGAPSSGGYRKGRRPGKCHACGQPFLK